MNQPSLSLSEVHERVRSHAAEGLWEDAGLLCNQLFELLPDHLLQGTAWHWISLLRLQQRHNEACCVLNRYLRRQPWGGPVEGRRPAPVLQLHGLDSLRRSNVQFISAPWEPLDFRITAGHFDSHALIGSAGLAVDHLYIDPDMDAARFEQLRDRLGHYPVIVNCIADPACETPALEMASRLLHGTPNVINPPPLVLQTERDLMTDCLRELPGLCAPRLLRYEQVDEETRSSLHHWLEYSPAGLVLRPVESQSGLGMERIVDPVMLDAWLDLRPDSGLFASEYVDFRHTGGLFRKFRVFVIGGQLWPEHMICARHWNLHSEDRYSLMSGTLALREAEQAFLRDPASVLGARSMHSLQAAAARTQLEYVGIDFALLNDGSLLIFELNPAMRLNYDHCDNFPYLRPHLDAVSTAFCNLIQGMLH